MQTVMPIVTCPYCNAPVPIESGERRVSCPRCEEMVTVRDADTIASTTTQTTPTEPPTSSSRLPNRTIAGVVIAVMLGMAALGLSFALRTTGYRRANSTKGTNVARAV